MTCKNVPAEKVAGCLSKFSERVPFGYRLSSAGTKVVVTFEVASIRILNEVVWRAKHLKNINLELSLIEDISDKPYPKDMVKENGDKGN